MKLFIGLGNPEERFLGTRHNVGFMLLDELAKNWGAGWKESPRHKALVAIHKDFILAKPLTFMNDSGKAVSSLTNYYKISPTNLYVIHDDLDIKLGEFKIQKGKGPKDHKGLLSIYKELKTKDFWHVRIGTENRSENNKEGRALGETYVLQKFSVDETKVVNKVFKEVIGKLEVVGVKLNQ